MLDAPLAGLQELHLGLILYVLLGVVVSSVIASFPGLGASFTVALLLPVAYSLDDPMAAVAMLTAAAVVTGTANTITSVVFGVPGSAAGVAVAFDGYPMSRRGEAGRAVAAGLTASLLGGLFGAAVMVMMLPVVRPLVLALGSPEFFALIVAAVVLIAYVQQGSFIKGLASGGLGLMAAYVGQEISTATLRFTFGQVYLWAGFQLVPVIIGLFAVAEMIELGRRGGSIAEEGHDGSAQRGGTLKGILDNFHHWRTTLLSSVIGVLVGLVPGLGSVSAQFMAYGAAARLSSNRAQFGNGAVEGVIAADACTNSKEGGALVPTLAFGIPGTSTFAVLLLAYISFGITPGQAMLTTQLHVMYMIIWILVISNVMATTLSLGFARYIAKLTFVPVHRLVAPILVVCLWGAYLSSGHVGDMLVAIGFGYFGYALKRFGYSRANFVIGIVLAGILERHFLLSMRLFGPDFILRPITATILVGLALSVIVPIVLRVVRSSRGEDAEEAQPSDEHR